LGKKNKNGEGIGNGVKGSEVISNKGTGREKARPSGSVMKRKKGQVFYRKRKQ